MHRERREEEIEVSESERVEVRLVRWGRASKWRGFELRGIANDI